MCQSVNLFWKTAVQKIGCLSVHFCGGHKINYGYIFVAPLSSGDCFLYSLY